MKPEALLSIIHVAERLKDTGRHCLTSGGRQEDVASHSWRVALMAMLIADEFPQADMDKVIRMCLIHDIGECFTGDIPVFAKTDADEAREKQMLDDWVDALPEHQREEFRALYDEMDARETLEAKLYKVLDGLEAIIQHNESDISSWEPHEYELNRTYSWDRVAFSPYLTRLREAIYKETEAKIASAEKKDGE